MASKKAKYNSRCEEESLGDPTLQAVSEPSNVLSRKHTSSVPGNWKDLVPLGVRFIPEEWELFLYLRLKVSGNHIPPGIIEEVDIYQFDPIKLEEAFSSGTDNRSMYFLTPLHKVGSRIQREATNGTWRKESKTSVSDALVVVGERGSYSFDRKVKKAGQTKFLMREYTLKENTDWALSVVYPGPRERRQTSVKFIFNDWFNKMISAKEKGNDTDDGSDLSLSLSLPKRRKVNLENRVPSDAIACSGSFSPLSEACSKMDLIAVHQILENIGYRDEEGVMTDEISFQMQDKSKKKGDTAFEEKDFKTAIECYTQFIDVGTVSPTVFARRSLSFLMSNMAKEAFNDAMLARDISSAWHIPCYLQAAALFALRMENEARVALMEASALEAKKNNQCTVPL